MEYFNSNRGLFQNESLAKQLVSFEGLKFKGRNGLQNVTPTDIDGLVQLDKENCFIFFELKHHGGAPTSPKDALANLVDTIQKGGANCSAIIATHNTPYPEKIMAKDARVSEMYLDGKWYKETKGRTLYEIALGYIDFIKEDNK